MVRPEPGSEVRRLVEPPDGPVLVLDPLERHALLVAASHELVAPAVVAAAITEFDFDPDPRQLATDTQPQRAGIEVAEDQSELHTVRVVNQLKPAEVSWCGAQEV